MPLLAVIAEEFRRLGFETKMAGADDTRILEIRKSLTSRFNFIIIENSDDTLTLMHRDQRFGDEETLNLADPDSIEILIAKVRKSLS